MYLKKITDFYLDHLNREELRNEWKILPLNEKAEFIRTVLMGPDDGRVRSFKCFKILFQYFIH